MLNWLWPWSRSPSSDTTSTSSPPPMASSSTESEYLPYPTQQPATSAATTSTNNLNLDFTPPSDQIYDPTSPTLQPRRGIFALDNNKKLMLGGATFLAFSITLTRRAFLRRLISTRPGYYTSSTYHKPKVNAAMDALEAMYLATLNVASFGMLVSGAALWKLGVNDLEGLRTVTRRAMGVSASGGESGKLKADEQIEEEVQEWLAKAFIGRYKEEVDREVERRVREREERRERGEE